MGLRKLMYFLNIIENAWRRRQLVHAPIGGTTEGLFSNSMSIVLIKILKSLGYEEFDLIHVLNSQ